MNRCIPLIIWNDIFPVHKQFRNTNTFMADHQKTHSLNIPDSEKPRLVLVGGGFGGVHFLKSLKMSDYQVVMIDRYNYHTFQPLLYQVATAGLEPDSVSEPLRKILKNHKDAYFRMVKLDSVHPEKKTIETSGGSLSYDYLVLATGAKMNYFGNSDVAKHAFPLKQVTHALDLRSHIFQQLEKYEIEPHSDDKDGQLNFVIVGAGPTGVEVSGALLELKRNVFPADYPGIDTEQIKVYLVEADDRVLPAMSENSAKKAQHYLEKMGAELMLKSMLKSYDGKTAKFNNGKEIQTNTLVWAAGVKPNLPKGFPEAGIMKGKLLVNRFNQVYSDESANTVYTDTFAIGDVALMKTEKYPKGHPGLAQAAIQQGTTLAKNLRRLQKSKAMKAFSYRNKGVLATIGRNKAVAEFPGNLRISGALGWWIWMIVHLLFLVGFRNKAIVLANWSWNYFTFDRGIRLILRPSTKTNDNISKEMQYEMDESLQQ